MTPDGADILMSGGVHVEMGKSPELESQGQHLVCFAGGMIALGGKLFRDEEHGKIGRKLTEGCIWAYRNMPLGIMPEIFSMLACEKIEGECVWDEEKWKAEVERLGGKEAALPPRGFTAIWDKRYLLRPEAIESVFILYRTTGDPKFLEAAWEMFESIINVTTTELANSAISDVTRTKAEVEGGEAGEVRMDSMESFWCAETLKYFYLIFEDVGVVGLDEWVFNTEAHMFRRKLP